MKFTVGDTIGFLISRTNYKLKHELNHNIKPFNVTTEQWGIVNTLWNNDGISQKELSGRVHKDQPTTARILDKLENKGFVKRRASPDDRRTFLIYLTEEGRNLRERLAPLSEKTLEKAMGDFSDEEINQLKKMLNRIYNNLD